MGLLLFLARELAPTSNPGNVLTPIDPFGLDFHISDPPPMGVQRSVGKLTTHGQLANQYVRFMVGFEISWTLGNRAVLKCQTVDPFVDDPAGAYRPVEGDEVTVMLRGTSTVLFRGTVLDPREHALEEPNTYTVIEIDATDVNEDLAHRFHSSSLGSDPKPIEKIEANWNPGRVKTREPHGLNTGDMVSIEGVVLPTGPHPANGDRQVTVTGPDTFTVPVNLTGVGEGSGGTFEKLVRLRDAVVSLTPILAQHGVTVDPDMLVGPLMRKQTFSDKSVADILRQLSGQSGWVHRFVPNPEGGYILQYFEPGTVIAEWTITKKNVLAGLKISDSKAEKANTVIVKYGSPMTITKHEWHPGNGAARVFPLQYKYSTDGVNAPGQVYVFASGDPTRNAQKVGVWGKDTDTEWTYRASDNALVQLNSVNGVATTPLPTGWIVASVFALQFPQTVKVSNVPVGHAPREIVVTNPEIFDEGNARDFGQSELVKSNIDARQASLTTDAGLVWPGTAITVDLPHRNMTGQWLVTAVRMKERGDGAIIYEYDLTEGNIARRLWQDKIRDLFGGKGGTQSISGGSPGTPPTSVPPSEIGITGTGTDNYVTVWTGPKSIGNAPMFLRGDGDIEFEAGIVANGNIAADLDVIAGRAVYAPLVRATQALNGSPNVILQPDGDVIVDPGGNMIMPVTNYDVNIGRLDRKFLTLHAAELWVETLVAQETMATIGGRIIVAPTTQLVRDLAALSSTIYVKYNNLQNGDVIYMESGGRVEFMRVQSGASGVAGEWAYTVQRNLDGTGANAWYAGDAMVNTGQPGNGFIDIYSVRGVRAGTEIGPTIVGNVRTSTEFNAWEPRWVVGNLSGLFGYPSAPSVYGAAFGSPAAAWIKIDPTNGVRIGHNNTTLAHITAAGSASFTGSVTVTGGNAATMTYADTVAMQQAATRASVDLSNVANAMVVAKTGWAYPGTTFINGGALFTGTIVANHIAAGQITADKMNVSTLSAISANLGTVTAGSITGVTITAGGSGGDVTLNSSGITIQSGIALSQKIKWSNGAAVYGASNTLNLDSGDTVILRTSSSQWQFNQGGSLTAHQNGSTIGVSSNRWDTLYVINLNFTGSFYWGGFDSQNAGIGYPMVISTDGIVHRATNGISGTYSGFSFENGICTGHP